MNRTYIFLVFLLIPSTFLNANELYTFEVREATISVALKTFQELRAERDPSCGNIFLSPGVAVLDKSLKVKFEGLTESQIIEWFVRACDAGYSHDMAGNYFILLPAEIPADSESIPRKPQKAIVGSKTTKKGSCR